MEYRIAIVQQLGGLLKSLRKERQITQEKLGERLGLTQRMVARLESNPEKSSFERVFQVLNAMEVDLVLKERETSTPPSSGSDFPTNSEAGTW